MNDDILRDQLVALLTKANAHSTFEDIIKTIPEKVRGTKPKGFSHTPWQLLEHLRIAQWDILEFSRDPEHTSPPWPEGYWPKEDAPPDSAAWDKSAAAFRSDLKDMVGLIKDKANDLFVLFPHGDGQTLLREALVLAQHNSYHLGQLMQLTKVLTA
jgi:hypothetical protein